MGYLHEGHLSLIRKAKSLSDIVITTIFVNPTQFGVGEDFSTYPRDVQQDQSLASNAGVDILFFPELKEIYPDGFKTYVEVEGVSSILEGEIRPTHFRGVTTIVAKLFNLTRPHVAFFGKKDAQQAFIIGKMVTDLNMDIDIHVEPIVREADGLAMSSRNVYLNQGERKKAVSIYHALLECEKLIHSGERSVETIRQEARNVLQTAQPTSIDYVAFVDPKDFKEVEALPLPNVLIAIAARFGSTRLIDNIIISTT